MEEKEPSPATPEDKPKPETDGAYQPSWPVGDESSPEAETAAAALKEAAMKQMVGETPPPSEPIPSTDDERVKNNTMRQQYRVLTEGEKQFIDVIKLECETLQEQLKQAQSLCVNGGQREYAIAITKLEEACMWAVKAVTK